MTLSPANSRSGAGSAYSGAKVTKSANQAINAATATALTWDQETWDTDGYHSLVANTSRLTAPSDGRYRLLAGFRFVVTEADAFLSLQKNGDGVAGVLAQGQASESAVNPVVVDAELAAGDYVEVIVFSTTASEVVAGRAGGFPEAAFAIELLALT